MLRLEKRPSPGFCAEARNPTSPRTRREVTVCRRNPSIQMNATLARGFKPLFGQEPHRGVGVHRLPERKALGVFAAELVKFNPAAIGLGAPGTAVPPQAVAH